MKNRAETIRDAGQASRIVSLSEGAMIAMNSWRGQAYTRDFETEQHMNHISVRDEEGGCFFEESCLLHTL
jgi:hypothetical protein